jgi:hypothetical protein
MEYDKTNYRNFEIIYLLFLNIIKLNLFLDNYKFKIKLIQYK